MSTRELTAADIALTESEEGFRWRLYYDVDGTPTIGYGTTAAAGVIEPLPQTCTEQEARTWLLEYMNRHVVPAILATGFHPNPNELGALADLGYNTGPGVFQAGTAMGDALRSGNRARIIQAFMLYDHDANGYVLSDLVGRRQAEIALFKRLPVLPPSYHYAWLPESARTPARRYDHWRRQPHLTRLERVYLELRRRECARHARQVADTARLHPLHGRPSWSVDHRGWAYQQLAHRGDGQLIKPS